MSNLAQGDYIIKMWSHDLHITALPNSLTEWRLKWVSHASGAVELLSILEFNDVPTLEKLEKKARERAVHHMIGYINQLQEKDFAMTAVEHR